MGRCDDCGATRNPGGRRPGPPAASHPAPPPPPARPPPHYLLRHGPEQARPVLGDQFPIQAQFPQIGVHGRRVLPGRRAALVAAVWGADGRLHVAGRAAGPARRGLAPHGRAAGSSTPGPGAGGGSGLGWARGGGGCRRRPEAAVRAHRGALLNAWPGARGHLPRAHAPRGNGGEIHENPRARSHFPAASPPGSATAPGGRRPHKFSCPEPAEARKAPHPSARGAGSGEARPAAPTPGAEEAERERRGLSSPHLAGGRRRGGERVGAPSGRQHPRSPDFVFAFGQTAERTAGGVVWTAAGSRPAAGGDARPAYPGEAPGRHGDYKSLQRGRRRRRPEPASRFPGTASASRPRVSASRRAATCAHRPARPAAHCAAGPREVRAPCVRGVTRDTEAAGSALCVFPNRGRTCLLPSPRPLLLAFPWRWL